MLAAEEDVARARRLEVWAVVGHALLLIGHEIAVRWHRSRWGARWDWASVLHRILVVFSAASLLIHARRAISRSENT